VHVDGKIVQSLRLLLTKPGFLSVEHFEGRKARYVSPIRLYLIFSVLYFAVAAFAPRPAIPMSYTPDPGESPETTEARRQEVQRIANETFTSWAPRAMFVMLPIFAGLVGLGARRSGRNYPQHLYFGMHVHAVWFFSAAVAVLATVAGVRYVSELVASVVGIYAALYFILAFRRAYKKTFLSAFLRTGAIWVTYLLILIASLIAIVLSAVATSRAGLR
jgi:hypothetical protein